MRAWRWFGLDPDEFGLLCSIEEGEGRRLVTYPDRVMFADTSGCCGSEFPPERDCSCGLYAFEGVKEVLHAPAMWHAWTGFGETGMPPGGLDALQVVGAVELIGPILEDPVAAEAWGSVRAYGMELVELHPAKTDDDALVFALMDRYGVPVSPFPQVGRSPW